MADLKTVTVDAAALREILVALAGSPHLIAEIQVNRGPIEELLGKNPITLLTEQFNAQVEASNG